MSDKLRRHSKISPSAGKPLSTIAYSPIPSSDQDDKRHKTLAIPLSAIQTTPNKYATSKDGEFLRLFSLILIIYAHEK